MPIVAQEQLRPRPAAASLPETARAGAEAKAAPGDPLSRFDSRHTQDHERGTPSPRLSRMG